MSRAAAVDSTFIGELSANVSIGGSSVVLASTTGIDWLTTGTYAVQVGEDPETDAELVHVTRSGATLTLASPSTTLTKAHTAGVGIYLIWSAVDANNKGSLDATNVWTGTSNTFEQVWSDELYVGSGGELSIGSESVSIDADSVGIAAGASLQFTGAPPAFSAIGIYPNEGYIFDANVVGGEILNSFLCGLYFLTPGGACTVYLRFDEGAFQEMTVRNDGSANLTLDIDPTSALTIGATITLTPGQRCKLAADHTSDIKRID